MRIAVVGSGISGNLAARILSTAHEVDLLEAAPRIGGHAHTVNVEAYGQSVDADVAFMVFNQRTYPHFCRMIEILGVKSQPSDMSLSVRCWKTGLEYQGSSIDGLFAQRRNLIRPTFLKMLWDIAKFNRLATQFCESGDEATLLGDFLNDIGVGDEFRNHYLIPMSAAIWSADPKSLSAFPAKFILGFLRNHGLLQIADRPQWMTIDGRSHEYVDRLVEPLRDRIRCGVSIGEVRRVDDGVQLTFRDGSSEHYDHVVMATHADQTLSMLSDADRSEYEVLSGFPYQPNSAVLHTDSSVLPKKRSAWASWNYHIPAESSDNVSVTYDLNRLQQLGLPGPLCLTLNPNCEIDSAKTLKQFQFEHPVFSSDSVESQRRFTEINGKRGVSFCGAYWGYGFHEDGVNSALAVTRAMGLDLDSIGIPSVGLQSVPSEQLAEVGAD